MLNSTIEKILVSFSLLGLASACQSQATNHSMYPPASSEQPQWMAQVIKENARPVLALKQLIDGKLSANSLQVIQPVFLPPELFSQPDVWKVLKLETKQNALLVSLQYCPTDAQTGTITQRLACQQRDFEFDLINKQFPMRFFQTTTTRENSMSRLSVNFVTKKAESCRQSNAQAPVCFDETLLPDVVMPRLTTMPEAFQYSPPLKLEALYSPPSPVSK